mmetsp:Transcript_28023/g.91617  ORF Transcript_28023/g.91617 Transcript_28023/m.91617 type:complete len:259 (+) Transcript_28023:91-867(+)
MFLSMGLWLASDRMWGCCAFFLTRNGLYRCWLWGLVLWALLRHGEAVELFLGRELHLGGEAEELERGDGPPRRVPLPPLEPVPRGELKGVVRVVPAFAKGEERDHAVVAREVARLVRLRAPHVRGAVDEPRDVVHPDGAEAEAPEEVGEAAEGVERGGGGGDVPEVRALDELVEGLLDHVRGVAAVAHALKRRLVVEQPSHVAPPKALVRRVRVLGRVAVEVVVAVRRDPLDRIALHRLHAAVRERVLEPLGRRERLM